MGNESLDRLLERCLQEMERTEDIEAVLRRYPEHADELRPLLQLAATMTDRYAGVPEPAAELSEGWARLSREADEAREAARGQKVAGRRQQRRSSMRLRLAPTLIGLALALAVGMAGMAGVARAAEGAVPGDVLYGPKRAMEQIQLRLTFDAEARAELRNELTERRMEELQVLSQSQDQERLQQALGEYGDAVGALIGQPEDRQVLSDPARVAETSGMLARHEEQLGFAFQMAQQAQDDENNGELDETDGGRGDDPDGWWEGTVVITHPVASSLASTYEISYTQVVSWFVEGYGFGEIMLALRTAQALEDGDYESECYAPGEEFDLEAVAECLLDMKDEDFGWGEVWLALGLIGPPDGAGPPEHAGPPDEVGPPDGAGPPDEVGPPEGAGPPDNVGPPEGAGPPDEAGPPEGVPPVEPGPPSGDGP